MKAVGVHNAQGERAREVEEGTHTETEIDRQTGTHTWYRATFAANRARARGEERGGESEYALQPAE